MAVEWMLAGVGVLEGGLDMWGRGIRTLMTVEEAEERVEEEVAEVGRVVGRLD